MICLAKFSRKTKSISHTRITSNGITLPKIQLKIYNSIIPVWSRKTLYLISTYRIKSNRRTSKYFYKKKDRFHTEFNKEKASLKGFSKELIYSKMAAKLKRKKLKIATVLAEEVTVFLCK